MKNKLFKSILFTLLSSFCFGQCIDVDVTFGNSGFISNISNDLSSNLNPLPSFFHADTQNNKITVYDNLYTLKRFNNDGSIDVSFGVNGICNLTTDFFMQKILVVGSDYYITGYVNTPTYQDIKIFKVDFNGNVSSLGTFDFGENEIGIDLVHTSDNKLMLINQKWSGAWSKLFLLKLNLDGTTDTTFQNNGSKEIYLFPQTTLPNSVYNYYNNKLLIVTTGYMGSNRQIGLVKMDENGNLDTSFNITGTAFFDNGNQEHINEVQMKDNKLYVRLDDGDNINNRIVVYNMNTLNIETTIPLNYNVNFYGHKFIVNDDGSIVVTSISDTCASCDKNSVLHKYLPDGTLDTSFCSNGSQEFNISYVNNYDVDNQSNNIVRMGVDKMFVFGTYSIPYSGGSSPAPIYFACARFVPGNLLTPSFKENKLILSPNPADDNLTIQLQNSINGNATLQIFNSLGQLVKQDIIDMTSNSVNIPIANLATDFYLIKIQDFEGNYYNSKFLKK